MESKEPEQLPNLLLMGLIVEGGLTILALVFAWFGFFANEQPLAQIPTYPLSQWTRLIGWGVAATIPMLIYLVLFHFWTPKFYRPMQQFVDVKLKPIFKNSSILEMLLLSLMAGFCEEIFFRWCLQGGITSVLLSKVGIVAATFIGVGIASLLFGGCHWVNASYGITTLIVGAYLGWIMVWSGSWLVPAIAHALFDFVAMIYIARSPPRPSSLISEVA